MYRRVKLPNWQVCLHSLLLLTFALLFCGLTNTMNAQPLNNHCSGAVAFPPYNINNSGCLSINVSSATSETENIQALGAFQMKWIEADSKSVLYAGEFNSDGVIQVTDYDLWAAEPAALEVYDEVDANLDGVIQVTDYDLWFFNKAKIGAVEIGF